MAYLNKRDIFPLVLLLFNDRFTVRYAPICKIGNDGLLRVAMFRKFILNGDRLCP